MAITQPAVTEQRNGPSTKQNHVTNVTRAEASADGIIRLTESHGALKSVDVADVDLVLGFADGSFIIIPNGALDALEPNAPKVEFGGDKFNTSLTELFQQVGTVDAADAGNLRIISENIDTRLTELQPDEIDYTSLFMAMNNHTSAPSAPAAPLPQAQTLPAAAQVQRGSLNGRGNNSGEAMDAIIPPRVDQPSTYRLGNRVETAENLNIGLPVINGSLYNDESFKVAGDISQTGLPTGARDASQAEDSVFNSTARNASSQAHNEVITGTSGDDNIHWNTAGFSSNDETWSKIFHLSTNGLDNIDTVRLTSSDTLPPGFSITGPGVTSVTSNGITTWFINPSSLNADGSIDLNITYDVGGTLAIPDFTINAYIKGTSGPFTFEVGKDFYFRYIDATTADDFIATKNGEAIMVLPSNGIGYKIDGGNGNDIISAGAGNDTLIGGHGTNQLDGGLGNNTASYENMTAGQDVTASLISNTGTVSGGIASDTYASIQNLTGGAGNDYLEGNTGANRLIGGAGNDTLVSGGGADTLDGGAGVDTASFAGLAAVNVVLDANGNGRGITANENVTLLSIESLIGTGHDDTFQVAAMPSESNGVKSGMIHGGAGNDTLIYNVTDNLNVDLVSGTVNGINNILDSIENITTGSGNDTIVATNDANKIDGGAGNNTVDFNYATTGVSVNIIDPTVETLISGGSGADILRNIQNISGSASGNDTITVGNFNSTIDARNGNNTITAGTTASTSSYNITAGTGDDIIVVNGTGTNVIDAGDGNNRVNAGNGNNTITTGNGNDTIVSGTGLSNITAGNGTNSITIGNANSTVVGGTGSDTVTYNLSTNVYANIDTGFAGTSLGTAQANRLVDIDHLTGGSGNDTLIGNNGDNILRGGAGNDSIYGGGGNDTIYGGDGDDIIDGGTGNNIIYGGNGADIINGGSTTGNNTAVYTSSVLVSLTADLARTTKLANANDTNGDVLGSGTIVNGGIAGRYTGGNENSSTEAYGDKLTNIQNLTVEGSGASYLIGNNQANILTGGSGNDTLEGIGNAIGLGGDTLNGGSGTDTVTYIHATAGVKASLGATGLTGDALTASNAAGITANRGTITGFETDTFNSIENLTGTQFADVLVANNSGSTLRGGAGNDTLIGGAGNDVLDGGDGNDVIYAAQGRDTVTAGAGNDTIYASVDEAISNSQYNNRFTSIDGGTGTDTLMLSGFVDNANYSLSTLRTGSGAGGGKVSNIDIIDIRDGKSTNLAVDASTINGIKTGNNANSGSILTIRADSGDSIVISDVADHWRSANTTVAGATGTDYFIYANATDAANQSNAIATVHWLTAGG